MSNLALSQSLEPISQAERLLAQASSIEDVVDIIDMAEAARILAMKAKLGLAAQNHAALIKLKAERKAGELLAQMSESGELSVGRPVTPENGPSVGPLPTTLAEIGINKNQSSRWQKIAENFTDNELEVKAGEAIEAAVELTQAALLRETNKSNATQVTQNTGHIEWYTPTEFIEAARTVMGGIDLDPASCLEANKVVRATEYYSLEDDGLDRTWKGRVWMNPPYANGSIDKFCTKLRESYIAETVTEAVVLVNSATETGWFQSLGRVANAFCLPARRISFWRPDRDVTMTGLQGQAFMYFGEHVKEFRGTFGQFGLTVVP